MKRGMHVMNSKLTLSLDNQQVNSIYRKRPYEHFNPNEQCTYCGK